MGQSRPLFSFFGLFSFQCHLRFQCLQYKLKNAWMVCLGFEPGLQHGRCRLNHGDRMATTSLKISLWTWIKSLPNNHHTCLRRASTLCFKFYCKHYNLESILIPRFGNCIQKTVSETRPKWSRFGAVSETL